MHSLICKVGLDLMYKMIFMMVDLVQLPVKVGTVLNV